MKKIIAILLTVTLFFSNNVFAFDNHQKIQHIENDIYEGIVDLYLSQSLAMPSSAAPYSDAELLMMLDLIDTNKFSKADAALYSYIIESLDIDDKNSNEYGKIKWGLDFNLEGYYHTNTDDFQRRENFIYNFQDHKPLLNIGFEAWTSTNFYGLGNFSVGNSYSTKKTFGSQSLNTNILALPPNIVDDLDFNMPYRAFIALGSETSSLSIGRDRVKWGNGQSSSLLIGDNLPYLDQLRYTTFTNQFKYTFLTAFFPHPSNYIGANASDSYDQRITYKTFYFEDENGNYNKDTNGDYIEVDDGKGDYSKGEIKNIENILVSDSDPTTGLSQGKPVKGTYALIAHRGEGRLFNNKLTIALSETIMFQSLDNVLDLRYLSPTAIFHNYYVRANANSMISAEIDYTPFKNFNIYGQVVVDEFFLPGEANLSNNGWTLPTAIGYLTGARYQYDVANKYKGNTTLEFVYTDPYLYLRGNGLSNNNQSKNEPGINYVVAFREFSNTEGTWYHNEFLGYKHGGDAIVLNLNSSVKNYGKWNLETNIFYMLHGTFDKYTCWERITNSTDPNSYNTPTTKHPDNSNNTDSNSREPTSNPTLRNSVSKTLIIGASASYNVNKNLSGFVQVDYININNYQNILNEKTSDVQLALSATYSL